MIVAAPVVGRECDAVQSIAFVLLLAVAIQTVKFALVDELEQAAVQQGKEKQEEEG